MKILTIEHLAPYLPYGLKVRWNTLQMPYGNPFHYAGDITSMDIYALAIHGQCKDPFEPIFHPFSDLTKEIESNGEKFVPANKLAIHLFRSDVNRWIVNGETNGIPYWAMQKLFEWHFDVFGLIKDELAIDINSLT